MLRISLNHSITSIIDDDLTQIPPKLQHITLEARRPWFGNSANRSTLEYEYESISSGFANDVRNKQKIKPLKHVAREPELFFGLVLWPIWFKQKANGFVFSACDERPY